jgi:hypothetical protein
MNGTFLKLDWIDSISYQYQINNKQTKINQKSMQDFFSPVMKNLSVPQCAKLCHTNVTLHMLLLGTDSAPPRLAHSSSSFRGPLCCPLFWNSLYSQSEGPLLSLGTLMLSSCGSIAAPPMCHRDALFPLINYGLVMNTMSNFALHLQMHLLLPSRLP